MQGSMPGGRWAPRHSYYLGQLDRAYTVYDSFARKSELGCGQGMTRSAPGWAKAHPGADQHQ